MIIPEREAAVMICPITPTEVPKVCAMSTRIKPVRIPTGLVESCEKKREGIKNLSLFNRTSDKLFTNQEY
jgi:hypothetical protein